MREHWGARQRRVRSQREVVHLVLGRRVRGLVPATVTLWRIGPQLLDGDNLQGALKAVRDEVAAAIGVDDRDPRLLWVYEQKKGSYSLEIRVDPGAPAPGDG